MKGPAAAHRDLLPKTEKSSQFPTSGTGDKATRLTKTTSDKLFLSKTIRTVKWQL